MTGHRRHEDQRPAARSHQFWRYGMGDIYHPHNVDIEHSAPVCGLQICERKAELARPDGRRMHDVLNRAQLIQGLLLRLLHRTFIGNVHFQANRGNGEFRHQLSDLFSHLGRAVPEGNMGPLSSKPASNRPANATRAPRYHNHMTRQLQIHKWPFQKS